MPTCYRREDAYVYLIHKMIVFLQNQEDTMHIYQKKKTQCITKKLKKGKIKNPSPWDDSVLHKPIPIGPLQYDQIFFCYYAIYILVILCFFVCSWSQKLEQSILCLFGNSNGNGSFRTPPCVIVRLSTFFFPSEFICGIFHV